MFTSANTVIGHIVDVQGDLLTATLVEDDQGHAPTVTIGDEDVLVGQLGSYVAVQQNTVPSDRNCHPHDGTRGPCDAAY